MNKYVSIDDKRVMHTRILEIANDILRNRKWLRMMIRSFFYALITTRISVSFAAIKLKQEVNRCNSIKNYVDLTFNIFNTFPLKQWTIRPGQVREEIMELLKILAKRRPKFILEIGTARGGTLFLFGRVSSPDAIIISIDLPGGQFGGGYPEWMIPLYKSFTIHKQNIYLVRKDSHAPSTLNMVEKILEGRKLDFLFIDGDHTYDGVKKDFEMYSPLVKGHGIVAFHDIVEHPAEIMCEVSKFWNEIKHGYKYFEIVNDWNQKWAGLGVLYV